MSDQTPEPFDALERRLAQRMRAYAQPAIEPIDPAALAHAAVTPRGPVVRLALPGPIASWPRAGWAALLATLLVLMLLGAMLATGAFRPAPLRLVLAPSSSPLASAIDTPSQSPSPSETRRSAFDGTQVAIENTGSAGLVSGVAYTSSMFKPRIAFRLGDPGQEPGQATLWCSPRDSDASTPHTSPRAIVLAWKSGCVSDLRIIRPFAVDCGTPDAHPDAAVLAAAILTRPGTDYVRDRGTLETAGAVPSSLFLGTYSGRVLVTFRTRNFDPKATNPDACRLLPEPGTGDPTIEIRGDQNALLILVDVGGELVVIRAGSAGYDGPTGAAGEARGYGGLGVLDAMLTLIYDIEFR